MKTYDAILVMGRGIKEDGSIPESAKATVRKAVEMYKQGVAKAVIFSGKWAYTLKFTPPLTEARAMANEARELGLPDEATHLEEESVTTVSNICNVKAQILEPKEWKHVLLMGIKPLSERALYNVEQVLGPDYTVDVVDADFAYPLEKEQELAAGEVSKMEDARKFYKDLTPGDHKAIFNAAMTDLEQNYIGKK